MSESVTIGQPMMVAR